MSTYKVIQDIEAEDHILGPLTLRQFIFALISAFSFYICFLCVTKGVSFLLILFLPPALFFGFFALPFGRDQPTEIWALAKLNFLFKPRRRVWDQSGVKELVTITVPKKIEHALTDGLSPYEVHSRLEALANTIDSRGWAIKGAYLNDTGQVDTQSVLGSIDRLIDAGSLPQEVPTYEIQASDDIMDERNNPVAHQFDEMINRSEQSRRQQLMRQLSGSTESAQLPQVSSNQWFIPPNPSNTDLNPAFNNTSIQSNMPIEEALLARAQAGNSDQRMAYSNLRTIQPLSNPAQHAAVSSFQQATAPVTVQPDPAIIDLANNNDFDVATIAREAKKAKHNEVGTDSEVVIPLR